MRRASHSARAVTTKVGRRGRAARGTGGGVSAVRGGGQRLVTDDAPKKADKRDQQVWPERHTPEYDRAVGEPRVVVSEESRWPNPCRGILRVRIGSEDPVSDQPDGQRDEKEPSHDGNAEKDQL